jgi:hypothetical protein
LLLAAIGMQATGPERVPAAHLFQALKAMRSAGLESQARLIAAEMMARTARAK